MLLLDTAEEHGFLPEPKKFASGDDVEVIGRGVKCSNWHRAHKRRLATSPGRNGSAIAARAKTSRRRGEGPHRKRMQMGRSRKVTSRRFLGKARRCRAEENGRCIPRLPRSIALPDEQRRDFRSRRDARRLNDLHVPGRGRKHHASRRMKPLCLAKK